MERKLIKMVITGGPCAGKTTAIEKVKIYLQNLGYCVLVVAETPTEIIKSGITLEEFGKIPFQKAIINMQIQKEEIILEASSTKKNRDVIILYDRGIIDHFTYVNQMEKTIIEESLDIRRDEYYKNYDAVFHMCSTAKELPKLFFNNECRKESVEEAFKQENLIKEAWKVHPCYYYIGCELDFDDKINKLMNKINEYMKKVVR